ncbi:MAG TPA: outer membrane protein transport protein [Desulfuromonadaceae bacterium]
MRKSSAVAVLWALLSAIACPSAFAQQIEISSSLNPVGSGARAAGMGGAFIGIADDATAASWNPAGLVHLEKPEFSFAYGYFSRDQSYSSSTHPELPTDNSMDASGINYASFAYPFTLFDKNMVVSLNYQRLFDMNKNLKVNYNFNLGGGDRLNDSINFTQKGYLSTITPAFAIQVMPELYLGVALNIWSDFLGTCSWESNYNSTGTGSQGGLPVTDAIHATNKYTFSGLNTTLGFLVNLDKFSIGGVFKSPFTANVDHTGTLAQSGSYTPVPYTAVTKETIQMDMPLSAGLGVAYRHNDNWTVGLDLYWTQWSEYVLRDATGKEFNPITTKPISEGRPSDTFQVRLGSEYLFINGKSVIPVRAGLFYDPEPGAHGVDDFFGFSVGSGYSYGNYSFDIAYQFRKGNNVTGDIPIDGVNSTITQHTLLSSLIYRF